MDVSTGGNVVIGADGTISLNGIAQTDGPVSRTSIVPSASLQPGAYGRFTAAKPTDAKQGLAPNDSVVQGSLEQSNGNAVKQMADMIQAVRIYEANSKSVKAVDDSQNQLITTLGAHPQG